MSTNYLIIIAGPTAIGKTAMAVKIAKDLQTEVLNADSRQVFREMRIGTAVPEMNERGVLHHFLGHRSIYQGYDASKFEQEVIAFLDQWYTHSNTMVMVGGSGLYIEAVCSGIDDLPSVDPEIRKKIHEEYHVVGLEGIRAKLKQADPDYYQKVDLNNPHRIMKALEITEMTGRPYSTLLTGQSKKRNFVSVKIGLDMPRKELHGRINHRVDEMMKKGLLQEAMELYSNKHLNALNTVGYKELFEYLEHQCTLDEAIEKIKSHTRQYARRQLTWFRRDKEITWFHPDDTDKILEFLHHTNRPPLRGSGVYGM